MIINGPNLNLLGKRQPQIYGNIDFESYFTTLKSDFSNEILHYFQSNHEGAIIDKIQELVINCDALIINPAAYGHTSIAIADALAILDIPIVEVHISNILEREPFRHHTFTSAYAQNTIIGKGIEGYKIAIQYLIDNANK